MIRFAELNDLPRVFELCMMAIKELDDVLPVKVSSSKLSDKILENWANAPCFVFEQDNTIEGFYGLTAYVPFYSKEVILGDYMLYLTENHKNYKNLSALSKAARDFAIEKKLPLELNFITKAKNKTKARFLEMMGADIVGVKAIYRGSHGR